MKALRIPNVFSRLSSSRASRYGVLLCVLLGLLCTGWIAASQRERSHALFLERFERDAALRATAVADHLRERLLEISALRRFFEGSDVVTPEEFSTFTAPVLHDRNGLRGFFWAPLVVSPLPDRQERRTVLPERDVHPLKIRDWGEDAADDQNSASPRALTCPVLYLEAEPELARLQDTDLLTIPAVQGALERAWGGERLAVSGRFSPEGGASEQFLVFGLEPVFRVRRHGIDDAETKELLGFVGGILAPYDVLSAIITATQPLGLPTWVVDLSAPSEQQTLAFWKPRLEDPGNAVAPPDHLRKLREFPLGDRQWAVKIRPGSIYMTDNLPRGHLWIPPFGVLLTALFGSVLFLSLSRKEHAESLVLLRTTALRTAEERLRMALEGADAGVWDWDTASGEIVMSSRGYTMLDYAPGDLSSSFAAWRSLLHDEDGACFDDALNRCMTGDTAFFDMECRMRSRGGSWQWILWKGKVVERNNQGRALRFAGVLVDVTPRKQAEVALREAMERLELVLEAAQIGVWEWEPEKGAFHPDSRWTSMLGYPSSDETPFTTEELLTLIHEKDLPGLRHAQEMLLAAGTNRIETEARLRAKDGSWRWMLSRGRAIDDGGTKGGSMPRRVAGIQLDITDRKEMEARLQNSLHEKEVLLREVHHRVKNNLQIISSLLSLQLQEVRDPFAREHLTETLTRIRSMALIHEHLYKQEFFSAILMATYTADLVLHIRSLYGKAGHELHFVLAIPETLLVDLDQAICCGLILTELLTNVLRHAFPPGHERKPEVKITLREERENLLVLEITDNGVGLPEAVLTEKEHSLGLRIVHALARQLDGTMTLRNAKGCVARLTFARTSRGSAAKKTL